jgi:hypothetical protein
MRVLMSMMPKYHGSALNKHTGEVITFQGRPTLAGLLEQTANLDHAFPGSSDHT